MIRDLIGLIRKGLVPHATYRIKGEGIYSGMVLMNLGLQYSFKDDYGSKVVILVKEPL
jgi:alpha-galactosidase